MIVQTADNQKTGKYLFYTYYVCNSNRFLISEKLRLKHTF